jgi:serine/threonine protein phosphatase 1
MQEEDDLLWIREPFLSSQTDHGFLVVHGHTPTKNSKPDLRSNRLNLDTGACFGEPLTAAAFLDDALMPVAFIFDDGQIGQVSAPDTKACPRREGRYIDHSCFLFVTCRCAESC